MAGATIPTLGRVLRSAARSGPTDAADRELLHRFAHHGDHAAFAALVGRHAGLVLDVCRRALPTVQDAERAGEKAVKTAAGRRT
jgi:hypothetical protein